LETDLEMPTTHNQKINGDDELIKELKYSLQVKSMELDSLLDITKAINKNLAEEDLYRIFQLTIRAKLDIDGLALYVFENDLWVNKANYGFERSYSSDLIQKELGGIEQITVLDKAKKTEISKIFEAVVPVMHKNKTLAYVLISVVDDLESLLDELLPFIQIISSVILVAIENKKFAKKQLEQEAMKKEMEIARKVQNLLFPKKLPQTNQVTIHAAYFPNKEVGGDYYDYVKLSETQFLVCIADVSGKGIPAAMLMSNFQASVRSLVKQGVALEEMVRIVNESILYNSEGEYFITFFGAIVDTENKKINYINAGHNPPLLVKEGKVLLLDQGTTILGMFDELPFINHGEVCYESNFQLFAYTDGLTEARNEQDEEFGDDNVITFLIKNLDLDTQSLNEKIKLTLDEFRGKVPLADDVTLLYCRVKSELI